MSSASRWRSSERLSSSLASCSLHVLISCLEPNQVLSYVFTQLEPLLRMPSRFGQAVDRLETGTLKVGVVPTDLHAVSLIGFFLSVLLGLNMLWRIVRTPGEL